MPFKRDPQVFTASIKETVVGTGDSAVTLGGENVFAFYGFDAPIAHPPVVGVEISDLGPSREIPGVAAFYGQVDTPAEAAKRACDMPGASFISLKLDRADPNGEDQAVEEAVATCRAVAEAVTLPLVIQGTGNVEKDGVLLGKIAEALEGRNVLLLSATEDNYKGIAVGAVLAYKQKVGAESAVDINLAKQLNVIISQMGVSNDNIVMNVGTAAAGYGFEYVASCMERIKGAALSQNDDMLQIPIITPVAYDAWAVKESVAPESDFPDWGPAEERGIQMEISTAVACLASGSNAVILKHPAAVDTVSKMISALM